MKDPVRDYLRERGCGEHVVDGGLEGLVESWEETVRQVEEGYSLTLDDYLNDLDARQLIAEALVVASDQQRAAINDRLSRADEGLLVGRRGRRRRRLDGGRELVVFRAPDQSRRRISGRN